MSVAKNIVVFRFLDYKSVALAGLYGILVIAYAFVGIDLLDTYYYRVTGARVLESRIIYDVLEASRMWALLANGSIQNYIGDRLIYTKIASALPHILAFASMLATVGFGKMPHDNKIGILIYTVFIIMLIIFSRLTYILSPEELSVGLLACIVLAITRNNNKYRCLILGIVLGGLIVVRPPSVVMVAASTVIAWKYYSRTGIDASVMLLSMLLPLLVSIAMFCYVTNCTISQFAAVPNISKESGYSLSIFYKYLNHTVVIIKSALLVVSVILAIRLSRLRNSYLAIILLSTLCAAGLYYFGIVNETSYAVKYSLIASGVMFGTALSYSEYISKESRIILLLSFAVLLFYPIGSNTGMTKGYLSWYLVSIPILDIVKRIRGKELLPIIILITVVALSSVYIRLNNVYGERIVWGNMNIGIGNINPILLDRRKDKIINEICEIVKNRKENYLLVSGGAGNILYELSNKQPLVHTMWYNWSDLEYIKRSYELRKSMGVLYIKTADVDRMAAWPVPLEVKSGGSLFIEAHMKIIKKTRNYIIYTSLSK